MNTVFSDVHSPLNTPLRALNGTAIVPHQPEMVIEGAQILPSPDKEGKIVGRDGRHFYVKNIEVLVQKLNHQQPQARLDIQHYTERAAYDYANAPIDTRAYGWMSNWRVDDTGALFADISVNDLRCAHAIRNRSYRYLSPALQLDAEKNIIGVSSVALVNNPNLKNKSLNEEQPMPTSTTPTNQPNADALAQEQAARAAAEARASQLETALAAQQAASINASLDAAITAGKITPAQKSSYAEIALNHADGITAGGAALNKLLGGIPPALATLSQKIAPEIHTTTRGGNDALSPTQLAACRLCNVPPTAYREMGKSERNVVEVAVHDTSRSTVCQEIAVEADRAGLNATDIISLNAAVTPALIGDLTRIFRNEFNAGLARSKKLWDLVAMSVPSTSKGNVYGWMDDLGEMKEWTGDRVVNDVKSVGYSLDNKNYELTIGLDANDIDDDNIGVYLPRFRRLGESAATKMDDLIREAIVAGHTSVCHDGQYYFDTDHPVKNAAAADSTYANKGTVTAGKQPFILLDLSREYRPFIMQIRKPMTFTTMDNPNDEKVFTSRKYRYGVDCRMVAGYGLYQLAYLSQTDLTGDNVAAAIAVMRAQLAATGDRPLGVNPTHILTTPQNEFVARALFEQPGKTGANDNQFYKRLKIIDSDWMSGASFS